MRFVIQNIGKIEYADIVIDGITVIAGENNTGKSTVGKALFCFFHGLNRWNEKYYSDCCNIISDIVIKHLRNMDYIIGLGYYPPASKVTDLVKEFFSQPEVIREVTDEQRRVRHDDQIVTENHVLMQEMTELLERYLQLYKGDNVSLLLREKNDEVSEWKRKLVYAIRDKEDLFEEYKQGDYIEENFKNYFKNQYRSFYDAEGDSICRVDIGESFYHIVLRSSGNSLNNAFHTNSRVFFIDSPVVYDRIAILSELSRKNSSQEIMDNILVPSFELMQGSEKIGDIPYYDNKIRWTEDENNKVEDVLAIIRGLIGGTSNLQKEGFKFVEDTTKANVEPNNVSTGVKHLALVEYMLRERLVNRDDIIILDEPEINMHPDWQLEYAKVLVLLQKALKIHIVVTTHSPFFIRAVECYTDYYDTMDSLNIYRSKLGDDNKAWFEDIMMSEWGTPGLYEDYSRQYEKLQEMLEQKYADS